MKKYFIAIVLILIISTFYPGLKREDALIALNSIPEIAAQHLNSTVLEKDLHIISVPLGGLVFTYEGIWYVTFWGKVI